MIAFKVQINDKEPLVGGAEDLCVLTAIVAATGKLGASSHPHRDDGTQDIEFRLGGLTARGEGKSDEHLNWIDDKGLKVGDRVTIEVIETDVADAIIAGEEAGESADDERAYFERCKHAYFEMRSKYKG